MQPRPVATAMPNCPAPKASRRSNDGSARDCRRLGATMWRDAVASHVEMAFWDTL